MAKSEKGQDGKLKDSVPEQGKEPDRFAITQLAAKLAAAIDRAGTNRNRIATSVGVHASQLNRWTEGRGEPRPLQLLRVARLLGVSFEFLVDDEMDAPPVEPDGLTPDERFVLQAYREAVADYGLTATRAAGRLTSPPIAQGSPPRE